MWRLEGVLEASWRRLGGVSELPCRFVVGLGHGIAFIVDFQKDYQQYERLVLIGFKDEPTQPCMMLCISVEVTWKLATSHGTL